VTSPLGNTETWKDEMETYGGHTVYSENNKERKQGLKINVARSCAGHTKERTRRSG